MTTTTTANLPTGMQINAPLKPGYESILTPPALELVAKLHRAFEPRRQELLKKRIERQARIEGLKHAQRPVEDRLAIGEIRLQSLRRAIHRGAALLTDGAQQHRGAVAQGPRTAHLDE